MRTIRASEIVSYLFCRRAWKYRRRGVESDNVVEMAVGTEIHRQHGRAVMTAGCMSYLAGALLLGAIVLLIIHFGSQVL
jgi:CRISPR/Cas system-associated exonuclease Cas4 (RecB family)